MPAIRVRALTDGRAGWVFAVEGSEAGDPDPTVTSIAQFSRWVMNGMSSYGNKGGIEASSLFKSYVAECFQEIAQEKPEMASRLMGLVVICDALPADLKSDKSWRLQRAILGALPGVCFVE